MTVWVIMGNDFPDCVFADEANAEAYVACMEAAEKKRGVGPRIYWRSYKFEIADKK